MKYAIRITKHTNFYFLQDYNEESRVIIQLLLYHNKSYLLNVPSWDESRDAVVCLVSSDFLMSILK